MKHRPSTVPTATAGVLGELAAALNPTGGALADALPFSLTPPVSRARDALPRSLFDDEPPTRCRACGVQADDPPPADPWYCPDCLDQGADIR